MIDVTSSEIAINIHNPLEKPDLNPIYQRNEKPGYSWYGS